MQIAKISLFDKICIAGGPRGFANCRIFITKYALLVGWRLMQIAKISMMKYKLLKSSNANCKKSLFDKICIAGGPGAYANCKNIYNKFALLVGWGYCKSQKYL